MRLINRFVLANILASVLLLSIFFFFTIDRMRDEEIKESNANLERGMRTFRELLTSKGTGFRIADGKLLTGSYVINGNFEIPDKIREIFGGSATVFMGDMRVSTNVRHANGNRAVGTRLTGPAYDAVIKQGKPYHGEANVLGIPYVTAYDPIFDAAGKTIGAIYFGQKKSEFLADFDRQRTQLLMALFCLLPVFTLVMFLFYRAMQHAEKTREADRVFHQTLLDTIPNPVFYKDAAGKYLGCNKAFETYSGLSRENLIGKTVHDITSPHQADIHHKADQELLSQQGVKTYESKVRFANGREYDVIFFKATFPAANGSPGGLIGTVHDITERKKMEMNLFESRQRLADILQFYPDATMVIDGEGKIVAWNSAMEELSGVPAVKMLGKGNYEYALPFYGERRPTLIDLALHPDADLATKYVSVERHGKTLVGEAYIQNARGEKLYFHGTATALHNKSGEITGAIESIRDVTRRKRNEDEISFKNVILNTQLEASRDGILVVDENAIVMTFNRRFLQMWGIPQELADAGVDALVIDFVSGQVRDPDTFQARIRYLYEHRDEKSEEEIVLKDGRVFDRYSAPMTGLDGKYYGRVWYFCDISKRKHAEEKVRLLNDELVRKEKLAILGQLSGCVGHELRNPLGVMNNAIIYLNMVLAETDETIREYLSIIKQEIDTSQRIINDLLGFARTAPPRKEAVEVGDLLTQSLKRCAIAENVDIRNEVPESLPCLKADPNQIELVLQNLITNGIQAMPGGGVMRISAHQADDAGNYVKISVKDSGMGISPENMKMLFQPLFTTKTKGMGLGLIVCKNLTEANGGWIEVESDPGNGTTFSILLPVEG